ncbi:MAG: FAD-dependent oxidoreductase, partial [Actinobacteria bacterium]|nr:FAD-dependent oxidoreductase [Actinomycetota bacterium]
MAAVVLVAVMGVMVVIAVFGPGCDVSGTSAGPVTPTSIAPTAPFATVSPVAPFVTSSVVPASVERLQVDVMIYGTTTSGMGAIRGLKMAAGRIPQDLTVALVGVGDALESPLAQGLCVEDDYEPGTISGFYQEFRSAVALHYETLGVWPYERNGRLTYEPEVAADVLNGLVFGEDGLPEAARGRVKIVRVIGIISEASDAEGDRHVMLVRPDGSRLRIDARYLLDASVEADLARALGCRYMMGCTSAVYNDLRGPLPMKPTREDLYAGSPQSLGFLVTLTLTTGGAPSIRERQDWPVAEEAEGARWKMEETVLRAFPHSWSMRHQLPGNRRELNELWSDLADPDVIVQWYREPDLRERITRTLQHRMLVLLAQVQDRYPEVGISRLPTWPYVRGEVMVLGNHLYSTDELTANPGETIATGKYAVFDRHDPVHGSLQPDEAATVFVPLAVTRPMEHPALLVSTAFSVDWKAYNSACRMEPVRATVGMACGVQLALAAARDVATHDISYA